MERGGGREQRRHVPLNNFKQREFAIFFFLIKVDGERFCWKKFPIFDFFFTGNSINFKSYGVL